MYEQRNTALDGLRGFAMLMVFVWHCLFITNGNFWNSVYIDCIKFSWVGMHLFFALSGFLITGILMDRKGHERYFSSFYARRFLRIFPLYYLVLTISFLLLPHLPHPKLEKFASIHGDEWSYWTYLCNFTIARSGRWRHPIVDVAWSLAIEEQFYIVWPLVVFALSPKRLFYLCMGILVGSALYRWSLAVSGANDMTIYVSTLARCDAIAAGSFVAVVYRYRSNFTDWVMRHNQSLLVGSILLVLAFLIPNGCDYDARPIQIFGHGAVALFAAALLLSLTVSEERTRLVRFFENRLLRTVGKYSYGFYLFHLPLRAVIRDLVYKPSSYLTLFGSAVPGQIIFVVISGCFVLGAAYISFNLFENPILSLKRYFEYSKDKSSQKGDLAGSDQRAA